MIRIILNLPDEGGDAARALQAAMLLRLSDNKLCGYRIGSKFFSAKRNKASISVWQEEAKAE